MDRTLMETLRNGPCAVAYQEVLDRISPGYTVFSQFNMDALRQETCITKNSVPIVQFYGNPERDFGPDSPEQVEKLAQALAAFLAADEVVHE